MDAQMNRRMALNSFLGSAIAKEYIKEVSTFSEGTASEIEAFLSKRVREDNVSELNFLVGRKAGLDWVLNVLKNFQEELEESISPVAGVKH